MQHAPARTEPSAQGCDGGVTGLPACSCGVERGPAGHAGQFRARALLSTPPGAAPREQHADPRTGRDDAVAAQLQQAGEPGRPGVADGDAGRLQRPPVGLPQRGLVDDHRAAAGGGHAAQHGEPVVGLVVEDAGGHAVRHRLPGPHERRAVRGGVAQRVLGAGRGTGRAAAAPAPRRGATARRLASAPCARAARAPGARRDRPRTGLHAGAGQRAAAHLHDEVVQRRRAAGEHLVDQRLAAIDGQAVLVALAAERQRAGAPAPRESGARKGRRARPARAGRRRPSRRARAAARAPPARRPAARRPAARATRRAPAPPRPAPRCRSWRWPAAARRPARPREVQQDAHQVARLVRAGDVAGLVLDPQLEPGALAQRGRRGRTAWPGSRGRRPPRCASSSRAHQIDERARRSRPRARAACQA